MTSESVNIVQTRRLQLSAICDENFGTWRNVGSSISLSTDQFSERLAAETRTNCAACSYDDNVLLLSFCHGEGENLFTFFQLDFCCVSILVKLFPYPGKNACYFLKEHLQLCSNS